MSPPHSETVMEPVQLQSVLRCPACGYQSELTMPTDACQFFFECPACSAMLAPKTGDCCVFCSYGTMPCPPIQLRHSCCGPRTSS